MELLLCGIAGADIMSWLWIHTLTTNHQTRFHQWRFPKMGIPPNHPILVWFSLINHPFWGTSIYGNPQIHMCFTEYGGCILRAASGICRTWDFLMWASRCHLFNMSLSMGQVPQIGIAIYKLREICSNTLHLEIAWDSKCSDLSMLYYGHVSM